MASDLETNLIAGGLTPSAAKIISNAIANVATGRTNIGRQLQDATPVQSMRLIDRDARQYVFTNLDYSQDNPFKKSDSSRLAPTAPHPYLNSQPATGTPTVTTPAVRPGKFIEVATGTANDVAQSEVALRVTARGGSHARLNHATGEIEAVPFLIEVDPQNKVEASVEERPDATVIRLRFISP